ncbi:MAG: GTP cyclohydrolase 1 type 2 [Phycisphaerae bacterium]|nr:GTP cyclohydrolase 1 type 2 [Phycisphaerae bacterium]
MSDVAKPKLADLVAALERFAPPALAADWDNNGLLVGDGSANVGRVLLAIDLTDAVLAEAISFQADLVICYHPPIFTPLRAVRGDRPGPAGRVFHAIRAGIALMAMHTTLDATAGGTNDALADVLGLTATRPLEPYAPPGGQKLVTFVPAASVEEVSDALFAAGAGVIGRYSRCSFRSSGTGTFLGGEGSNPTLGQAGRMEQADEVRLEVVVPAGHAADAVAALRRAHPYEEVAFDLYPLAGIDERVGMGRIGELADPAPLATVVERIKAGLGVEAVWLAAPRSSDETPSLATGIVSRAACCAGSCGRLFERAMASGAQLYLTGELRHHDALAAVEAGMAVVMVRHSVSERLMLSRLADRVRSFAPHLEVRVSTSDADPFAWA